MILYCIRRHRTLRKCQKRWVYMIVLITFMIIFPPHEYFFIINKKLDLLPMIRMEFDSQLSVSMIYEDRSSTLSCKCNHSRTAVVDIIQYTPARLTHTYPWLNSVLFPLQSNSLMYCAVPKIASKTLVSLVIYVYVRDFIAYLNNHTAKTDANRTRAKQFIDFPKLIRQLQKNQIPIPIIKDSKSVASFLQTYLHILRFETINGSSPSLFLNPFRLNLQDIFPDTHFKSILNISNLFSPSFTRVLFVRHPFERLASAYKERIATLAKDRIQQESHYDSVRKDICRRYTHFDSTQRPLHNRNPCEEFIPPFEHFVKYVLINTETPRGIAQMDTHWQPYTEVCQVCKFKYNFIGKYETFNDDFTSLLKRLNVSDWNNQKRRGASGQTASDYQQLFSSLSDDLICRLKRLYSDDFRLFNYRSEDYVNRTTLIC